MSDENGNFPVVKNPNLRPPWPKGQSGNPEGKNLKGKNGGNSLKQAIISVLENEFPELGLTEIPVDHIRALINKPKTKLTNRDVMAAVAVHAAFKGDFRYFKEIMDRIDGPVTQKMDGEITHINVPVIDWVK